MKDLWALKTWELNTNNKQSSSLCLDLFSSQCLSLPGPVLLAAGQPEGSQMPKALPCPLNQGIYQGSSLGKVTVTVNRIMYVLVHLCHVCVCPSCFSQDHSTQREREDTGRVDAMMYSNKLNINRIGQLKFYGHESLGAREHIKSLLIR